MSDPFFRINHRGLSRAPMANRNAMIGVNPVIPKAEVGRFPKEEGFTPCRCPALGVGLCHLVNRQAHPSQVVVPPFVERQRQTKGLCPLWQANVFKR